LQLGIQDKHATGKLPTFALPTVGNFLKYAPELCFCYSLGNSKEGPEEYDQYLNL